MTITRTGFLEGDADLNYTLVSKEYVDLLYPGISSIFKTTNMYSWGWNVNGNLGDGTADDKSTPTIVVASSSWKCLPINMNSTSSGAIKGDNPYAGDCIFTWGCSGTFSGAGLGSPGGSRCTPVQIANSTDWKSLSVGARVTGAVKTDGSLWMWGFNDCGTLGDGTTISKSTPVQISSGSNQWKMVYVGPDLTAAAITYNGTLWLWGKNTSCELGAGCTVSFVGSPVQTLSGGTNWKSVSIGDNFVGAIKTDGTLWMWGLNNIGQLGTNDTDLKSCPVQTVAGGTNWKQISAGNDSTAAIKTDGSLWTWGWNITGELGDNTTTCRSSPAQTISGGTNWRCVSAGTRFMAALKTDGSLWTWGCNNFGQLGDGTTINKSSPVQTSLGGNNWKQVVASSSFILALSEGEDW